jgi:aminopeptidase N
VTCRDWFQLTLKEGLTVYRVGLVLCWFDRFQSYSSRTKSSAQI